MTKVVKVSCKKLLRNAVAYSTKSSFYNRLPRFYLHYKIDYKQIYIKSLLYIKNLIHINLTLKNIYIRKNQKIISDCCDV